MAAEPHQPRMPRTGVVSLKKEDRINLGAVYFQSDDAARSRLIAKWGKGRMRRALREFASHEIEASFEALKMREEI